VGASNSALLTSLVASIDGLEIFEVTSEGFSEQPKKRAKKTGKRINNRFILEFHLLSVLLFGVIFIKKSSSKNMEFLVDPDSFV
jgi:hypothetical protein